MGIIVVNYASSALLEGHGPLSGLEDTVVIVVDNWSSADERTSVRQLTERHGWSLVEMDHNAGFGAGVNAGAARALQLGCSSLLLLNPDARVSRDTVRALRQACLAQPDTVTSPVLQDTAGQVVFAGSVLNLADGRSRSARRASHWRRSDRPVSWVTAACLAVPVSLWRRADGFAEDYFMYWEDVDFTFRCLAVGGRVNVRDDLVAVHDQGGTQGPRRGRAKSALYYYYNCRNRLAFAATHLVDSGDLVRWLVSTPTVSWEILLRGGRRQLMHSPDLAVAAARGALAGSAIALRRLLRRRRPTSR